MTFFANKPTAPQPTPTLTGERVGRAPRPDCAIWNDIARALGTVAGPRK